MLEFSKKQYLKKVYWSKSEFVSQFIYNSWIKTKHDNVLEIGAGPCPFSLSTHFIDVVKHNEKYMIVDIDFEPLPYETNFFDYVYSRHTVEDIYNPIFAIKEMFRISNKGYIETPSPLVETFKNVDGLSYNTRNISYSGYIHHRFIFYTDIHTNTLYILPKYPIIDFFTFLNDTEYNKYKQLLENCDLYWNNYYFWDETSPPNIILYRNDINFNIISDYFPLLEKAITKSIEATMQLEKHRVNC